MSNGVLEQFRQSQAESDAAALAEYHGMVVRITDGEDVFQDEIRDRCHSADKSPADLEQAAALVQQRRAWREMILEAVTLVDAKVDMADFVTWLNDLLDSSRNPPLDDHAAFMEWATNQERKFKNAEWKTHQARERWREKERAIKEHRARLQVLAEAARGRLVATNDGAADGEPVQNFAKVFFADALMVQVARRFAQNPHELPAGIEVKDLTFKQEQAPKAKPVAPAVTSVVNADQQADAEQAARLGITAEDEVLADLFN